MPKKPQSAQDLQQHLVEQIGFLQRSADAYDEGFTDEAKRLAATLRLLLHDTKNSTSLLTQLEPKQQEFLDTSVPDVEGNLLPYGGLVYVAAGMNDATYVPFLDSPLPQGAVPRKVSFDEWWATPIIRTVDEDLFSRRDLVLCIADQDGGAHVDPKLDEAYARLSRESGIGWEFTSVQGKHVIRPADRAAVRQIAHELMKTFDPSINKHPKQPAGTIVNVGSSVAVISGAERKVVPVEIVVKQEPPLSRPPRPPAIIPFRAAPKPRRNDPCPCGSGKKFKKCHGR